MYPRTMMGRRGPRNRTRGKLNKSGWRRMLGEMDERLPRGFRWPLGDTTRALTSIYAAARRLADGHLQCAPRRSRGPAVSPTTLPRPPPPPQAASRGPGSVSTSSPGKAAAGLWGRGRPRGVRGAGRARRPRAAPAALKRWEGAGAPS